MFVGVMVSVMFSRCSDYVWWLPRVVCKLIRVRGSFANFALDLIVSDDWLVVCCCV